MGVGTTSGVRLVIGMWDQLPVRGVHGRLRGAARRVERAARPGRDRRRVRLRHLPLRRGRRPAASRARRTASGLELDAGQLRRRSTSARISPLGRLLRIVPKPIARDPRWLRAINPVARLVAPGAGTAGSAGNGRREYYGVTGAHDVTGVRGTWAGEPLGDLAPLDPPVRVRLRVDAAHPAGRRRRDHHPRARLTDPRRAVRSGRGGVASSLQAGASRPRVPDVSRVEGQTDPNGTPPGCPARSVQRGTRCEGAP